MCARSAEVRPAAIEARGGSWQSGKRFTAARRWSSEGAMVKDTDRAAAAETGMDADCLDALVAELDSTYVATGKLPHMHLLVSRDERVLVSATRGAARDDRRMLPI